LYNGATDADAAEYAQTIKVYNLSDSSNPSPTNYIHVNPIAFNSLPTYDHTFFEDINHLVQSNPVRTQDKAMIALLEDIGITKGQPFEPNETQKKAINEGTMLAWESMQHNFNTPGKSMFPLWPGKNQWQMWNLGKGQAEIGFPFENEEKIFIELRAGYYFFATYLPKYLGGGTFYLTGLRDSDGNLFTGNDTYTLNVPANTPAKDFWSVIPYSTTTKGFIKGVERIGLSSRNTETMQINEDGSYDIYFGPTAPVGKESNWIPTVKISFCYLDYTDQKQKTFIKRGC